MQGFIVTYMKKTRLLQIKSHGFNLVEAAIVLGVVGLVIGGIWVAASSVKENNNRQRALTQILQVAENTRNLFRNNPPSQYAYFFTCCANSVPNAAWSTVFPADMLSSAISVPFDPWGHLVYLTVWPNATMTFTIGYNIGTPMSVSTCAALAPRIDTAIRSQYDTGTVITTGNGMMPVNTPALASANCQTEFDTEGYASLAFTLKY